MIAAVQWAHIEYTCAYTQFARQHVQVPVERCDSLINMLNGEEKAYVTAAVAPEIARQRLLARVLVRAVLAAYLPGAATQQVLPPRATAVGLPTCKILLSPPA
jgi:hypothetical protein